MDAAAVRHQQIADRLEAVGRVEVCDLAVRFEVAQETIRRDLKLLEQQGILERVHGGAVRRSRPPLSPYAGAGPPLDDRHLAIGDRIVDRLPDHGSVFIGASPHTAAVAEALTRRSHCTLSVVTSSLDVAVSLSRVEQLSVYNVGGSLALQTREQQGDWALEEIARFHVQYALLPASGIDARTGWYVDTPMEAALAEAAVGAAEQVWLVTAPEALGRRGFVRAATADRIDSIFVSGRPDARHRQAFDEAGIAVVGIDPQAGDSR